MVQNSGPGSLEARPEPLESWQFFWNVDFNDFRQVRSRRARTELAQAEFATRPPGRSRDQAVLFQKTKTQ